MAQLHSWYNGLFYDSENLKISQNDLGFLRGYGLFDYFRTYNRKPFQWDAYWQRFQNSASLLRIPLNISKEEAIAVVNQLIALSSLEEVAIRFVLTGGDSPDSSTMTKPNLLIRSEPIVLTPVAVYQQGISIISHQYVRDMPEIKSTDYKRLMYLSSEIKEKGATDVLFYDQNSITELSRSNIFLVSKNKIITTDKNILKGITRQTVLSLAEAKYAIEIRDIQIAEVFEADEVFTTSSNKKVLGISKIDDKIIGNGEAGKVSLDLLNLFDTFTASW